MWSWIGFYGIGSALSCLGFLAALIRAKDEGLMLLDVLPCCGFAIWIGFGAHGANVQIGVIFWEVRAVIVVD